jgi:hypothetical protein
MVVPALLQELVELPIADPSSARSGELCADLVAHIASRCRAQARCGLSLPRSWHRQGRLRRCVSQVATGQISDADNLAAGGLHPRNVAGGLQRAMRDAGKPGPSTFRYRQLLVTLLLQVQARPAIVTQLATVHVAPRGAVGGSHRCTGRARTSTATASSRTASGFATGRRSCFAASAGRRMSAGSSLGCGAARRSAARAVCLASGTTEHQTKNQTSHQEG